MTLDPDICYRAVKSRDARFDGRFFTGVISTGVYCRPVCPARTPRPENVRYFECAAAAEEAGFRPCMRCRPETSPGTPAWVGSSATVSRALRLIDEGFLDRAGVDELSSVLGVGPRHLRRLFDAHLGASPTTVALTRRVHFARRLIDQTRLPVTEVAYSAGFSSVRRFNDAFRKVFGRSPSRIRRAAARRPSDDAVLTLRLPYRPPIDFGASMAFLGARALDGVELVDGSYRRSVAIDGVGGVIEVSPGDGNHLVLTVSAALSRSLPRVVERVRRVFDLGADPHRIASHLASDPALAGLVRRNPGLRVTSGWDGFEVAVRAVVGQQVSVAGARTVVGRIAREYGEPIGEAEALFPTPERLRHARLERLGMTRARARAIRALASAVLAGDLDFDRPADLDDAVTALTRIDGVGRWTAHYIAMRGRGDPDAFPSGDRGLLKAARHVAGVTSERSLRERAERWRPWRAYAAVHLWHSLQHGKDSKR